MAPLALLTTLFAGLAAAAVPPPVPCGERDVVAVQGRSILELEDGSGELTLEEVRSASATPRWRANPSGVPSRGYSDAVHWFWFSLQNNTADEQRVIVEYAWPVLEKIDVYVVHRDAPTTAPISSYAGGGQRQFDTRPLPHHHFLVPGEVPPGEVVDVYTRVETSLPLQLPVSVHREQAFYREAPRLGTIWGVYFGFMLLIGLYNLILFFALREASHIFLALFVTCTAGLQASFSGHAHQYLFSTLPALNVYSSSVFLNGTVLFGILFTIRFLDLRETAGPLHKFFLITAVLTGINLAVVPLFSVGMAVVVGNLLVIPVCLAAILTGTYLGLLGFGSAKVYTLAWGVLLIGATALALNKLGVVPYSVFTEYGWSVGAMLMAVLLSLGLAYSIDSLKRQREKIQQLVRQRTAELKDRTEVALSAQTEAVTARRESDRLRGQAEQYAAKLHELDLQKTAFFRSVSHELRTPLTLILNPLDTERRGQPENRNISVAAQNARRLLRLVNQLLDFQKLEAGRKELHLEVIDLAHFAQICASYFRSTCASKEIVFRVTLNGEALTEAHLEESSVFIQGESDALEKIAFNLLSNALKYTPRGGTIELGLSVGSGKVRLFVKDTGPGISAENQKRLFNLFSQVGEAAPREYEGTGLGLALVKELAELMGGRVGVESEVGTGSLFWSEFPRCAPPDGESAAPVQALQIRDWLLESQGEPAPDEEVRSLGSEEGSGPAVLVVDDLADMRALISSTLQGRGYRVLTAPDGARGLEVTRERRPDLIITDWMMPVMDGPELIKRLKEDPEVSSIPVVLLTARSDEESKLLGTELGADAFIGKPFNELELVSIVHNLTQLKARERDVVRLNRRLVEDVLKRYLPPELVDQITSGATLLEQEPRSTAATILFSDLSGFTSLSSDIRAAKMARVLNQYLSRMTEVVFAHSGTIDKFIGDAIMVIFGAPVPLIPEEQAAQAIRCAEAMQGAMEELNHAWQEEGLPGFKMRIGIHHGPVVVGSFGSELRSEYTAIGPTVNLASRIESVCEPGQIYISGELYDYLPEERAEKAGAFELKGVEGTRHIYRVRADTA